MRESEGRTLTMNEGQVKMIKTHLVKRTTMLSSSHSWDKIPKSLVWQNVVVMGLQQGTAAQLMARKQGDIEGTGAKAHLSSAL